MSSLMNYTKSIFVLILLMHYYVYAMHENQKHKEELSKCNAQMIQYYGGLTDYMSCAIKSLMFHNYGNFNDDYGFLFFLTLMDKLLTDNTSMLKPTEFCITKYAEYNENLQKRDEEKTTTGKSVAKSASYVESRNKSSKSSESQYEMEFKNDKEKTEFVLNLVEERRNVNKTSFGEKLSLEQLEDLKESKYKDATLQNRDTDRLLEIDLKKSDEEGTTSGKSVAKSALWPFKSLVYKYDESDNDYVNDCKRELNNCGFPDVVSKETISFIFGYKRYTDCKHCRYFKGYMYHLAITIKINYNMPDPGKFCSDFSNEEGNLLDLIHRRSSYHYPEPSTNELEPDPELKKKCIDKLSEVFKNLTNFKEIGDFVLYRIASYKLRQNSFESGYIGLLFNFITPGYIKSIKTFCQDYPSRNFPQKIKLMFNIENDSEATVQTIKECKLAIEKYKFSDTGDKNDILRHAFFRIECVIVNDGHDYIAEWCILGDWNSEKLFNTIKSDINFSNDQVYIKAYLEHIKMNYRISPRMESPTKFCNNNAKGISRRKLDMDELY